MVSDALAQIFIDRLSKCHHPVRSVTLMMWIDGYSLIQMTDTLNQLAQNGTIRRVIGADDAFVYFELVRDTDHTTPSP
jgi:hypothetical protein